MSRKTRKRWVSKVKLYKPRADEEYEGRRKSEALARDFFQRLPCNSPVRTFLHYAKQLEIDMRYFVMDRRIISEIQNTMGLFTFQGHCQDRVVSIWKRLAKKHNFSLLGKIFYQPPFFSGFASSPPVTALQSE